ncbi:MAG TPA: hypothetical protein VMC06_08885 [Opitutaceae bacterium]|nr:hypothetical protein [Opitutaceae bacterium]
MHNFIPQPGDDRAPAGVDPAHTAAIREWTREILRLDAEAVVTVTELACADPGCPIRATLVAVFEEGRTRKWTFSRPRFAVTKLMVQQALAGQAEG